MQKYCTKCGEKVSQNSKFCVSCDKENNRVKNNSASNTGNIVVVLIILFLILTAVFSSSRNTEVSPVNSEKKRNSLLYEEYKDEIEGNNSIINTKNNIPTKIDKCSGQNDVVFLEKNYKLYDLYNYDRDIKFNSNEMKVYGIIKNNSSECSAKNIKMKVLLEKNGIVMQEVNIKLKDVIVYSGKTGEYSEKFEVYESLLNIEKSTGIRRLKSDINASIIIYSVNEPLSDFEKKYPHLIP